MATTESTRQVSTEAVELWTTSYQGEVFGEAYFAHMAAHADDVDARSKLDALTTLERCTKELLEPPMRRLGISTAPDQAVLDGVAASTDFDYRPMLEAIPVLAAEYLGFYRRLRQLVGPEDESTIDLLIAHEMALELFARRELAGETEASVDPIKALSHVTL